MLNYLPIILFFSFTRDSASFPNFYYYKDSLTTEVISINTNGSYECYKQTSLAHVSPSYCQGYYESNDTSFVFHTGIVDSLILSIKEQNIHRDINKYFSTSTVKIISGGDNFKQFFNFNYDHLNKVSYDMDIRLCIEDTYGTRYYKRLNTESMDFGEVVSEGCPLAIYIMVGQYVVTKKYYSKNHQSNYFEISINKNDLFAFFKDFYLSNHRFKKIKGQLVDLGTGRIYTAFTSGENFKNIKEIVNTPVVLRMLNK